MAAHRDDAEASVLEDRITLFDKEDQRSKDSLKEVSLPPASEIVIADNRRKEVADAIAAAVSEYVDGISNPSKHRKEIELISRTSQEDIGRVREGISLSAPAKWLKYIIPDACSVLDYIDSKKNLFIMDEMTDAVSRLRAYGAEYTIRCRESFEKGIAPKSAMAALHDTGAILKQVDSMPGGVSFSSSVIRVSRKRIKRLYRASLRRSTGAGTRNWRILLSLL